jgi:hypothetical protein
MAVYLAILRADQPGKVFPIFTTRNPEILAVVRREINRYMQDQSESQDKTPKHKTEARDRG